MLECINQRNAPTAWSEYLIGHIPYENRRELASLLDAFRVPSCMKVIRNLEHHFASVLAYGAQSVFEGLGQSEKKEEIPAIVWAKSVALVDGELSKTDKTANFNRFHRAMAIAATYALFAGAINLRERYGIAHNKILMEEQFPHEVYLAHLCKEPTSNEVKHALQIKNNRHAVLALHLIHCLSSPECPQDSRRFEFLQGIYTTAAPESIVSGITNAFQSTAMNGLPQLLGTLRRLEKFKPARTPLPAPRKRRQPRALPPRSPSRPSPRI